MLDFQRKIKIKRPDPANYEAVFWYSFKLTEDIANNENVYPWLLDVASGFDINKDVLIREFRRYVLNAMQYKPAAISFSSLWKCIPRLIRLVCRLRRQPKFMKYSYLIDDWYAGSVDGFYGTSLLMKLEGRYCAVNVSSFLKISFSDIWNFRGFLFKILWRSLWISFSAGINICNFSIFLIEQIFSGRFLKDCFSPDLILTGNDNGASVLKAVGACAKLVRIQNGLRGVSADAAFLQGDIYVGLGIPQIGEFLLQMGGCFREIVSLGSIRLANRVTKIDGGKSKNKFKCAFISSWPLVLPSPEMEEKYGVAAELKLIHLVNQYAAKYPGQVAFCCCYEHDTQDLKNLNLYSEDLTYITLRNGHRSSYETLVISECVISSCSTMIYEAASLGIPAGFINLSENQSLNSVFAGSGRELVCNDINKLEAFIEMLIMDRLKMRDVLPRRFDYIELLAGILKLEVSKL